MRVRVFLKKETVLILLKRKCAQRRGNVWVKTQTADGPKTWLARQVGVSPTFIMYLLERREPVPDSKQAAILNAFKGMSHKPGGRLSWDDLFEIQMSEAAA